MFKDSVSKTNSRSHQIIKMEPLVKIVSGFKSSLTVERSATLDLGQGPVFTSAAQFILTSQRQGTLILTLRNSCNNSVKFVCFFPFVLLHFGIGQWTISAHFRNVKITFFFDQLRVAMEFSLEIFTNRRNNRSLHPQKR